MGMIIMETNIDSSVRYLEIKRSNAVDAEDRILSQHKWLEVETYLSNCSEAPDSLLTSFKLAAQSFINGLANESWDGIGVFYEEDDQYLEAILDCYRTEKRIMLRFYEGHVHVFYVSRSGVIDLGTRRKPYNIPEMARWLVSD